MAKYRYECTVIVESDEEFDDVGSITFALGNLLHHPEKGMHLVKHDWGTEISEPYFHGLKNAIFTEEGGI